MSYSFDTNGWDLFNTPFSTSVKTAEAPTKQKAEKTKMPEASLHSTTMTDAQHSALPTQRTVQQKTPSAQKPEPDQSATSHVQNKRPAPSTAQAQTDAQKPGQAAPSEAPATAQTDTTRQKQTAPPKSPVPAGAQPAESQKELVLDMSSGSVAAPANDDTEKRKAHEAAEAKRKAEWDARQLEKKQKEAEVLRKLQNMSDADIIAASTKRISLDVERLTRRNMKECVSEHIQDLCRKDPAFARLTMHPKKSMINCFKYINRMAKEYIKQEMADNDTKPENGIYGCDVPDGIVLGWSEEYMHDADAPEDQEKEEKFTPKPYINTQPKAKATASKTKKPAKTKKKEEKQTESGNYEQMSFV